MDPEGETTWALVVGIDKYDDDEIPVLTGAVADAVAATRWLQRLGVPQSQILLHAAPSEKSAGRLAAVQCWKPCRAGDIWESLGMLRGKKGSRLFVFLFGHGLFEDGRPEGRLFLAQDFGKPWFSNLSIEWHCKYLLSLGFSRQFLIMDGCLNESGLTSRFSEVPAGRPPAKREKLIPRRRSWRVLVQAAASGPWS